MLKQKVEIDQADRDKVVDRLAPALTERFADAEVNRADGLRLDWPDRWVHVRPSNTEPILRVIAEAPTEADAQELAQDVRQALGLT